MPNTEIQIEDQNFPSPPQQHHNSYNNYLHIPSQSTAIPKGLPRTKLIGGNSLLDEIEISAAASSITYDPGSLDNSNNYQWDQSPKQSNQRILIRPQSSISSEETSDTMMHYAESDIPLPLPPLMSTNNRFINNNRLFHHQHNQHFYRPNQEIDEDDLGDEESTVETQVRSSDEVNRHFSQREHSQRLKRGGVSNSARHATQPTQLTSLQRHQSHYFSNVDLFQQNDSSFNYLKYARASDIRTNPSSSPHVRIINLCFDFDPRSNFDRLMLRAVEYRRLLQNITFELFAGDTLALLYTTESEMQTFIRVLAQSEMPQGKVHGVLEINGHKLKPRQFGDRVGHVSGSELHSGLTLIEYLNIYSSLIQPATNSFKKHETIEHLIQGLALTPFCGQLVENLGPNEIQRLKLASKMLLDTDLLICENILRDMDLYDMAFIIDFIRDWAQRLKRIVIIAINPPTMEILTMFGKAAILTCSGRFVFMGESQEMIPYFESIGYTCPAFKNACDYYIDLVTHDVLTLESARESMTRIRTLSEIWNHKMPALNPPKGNIVSPKIQNAGSLAKTFIVYKLFWYRILNRPLALCWEIAFSILISLIVGWLFFQLPLDRRSGINDRQGFLCALLLICQIPIGLFAKRTVIGDWPLIEHACQFQAFSRRNYLFAKLLFDLPLSTIAAIAYAVPSYILASQNPIVDSEMNTLVSFVAVVYINFMFCRYMAWCFAFVGQTVISGSLYYCITMCVLLVFSGFVVHPEEQILSQIQFFNPVKALASDLLRASYTGKSKSMEVINWLFDMSSSVGNRTELFIDCQKKKILATKLKQIPIYTVTQCLKTTGSEAFRFSGFLTQTQDYKDISLLLLGVGIMIFVSLIALVHQRHITQKPISIRTFN